MGGIKVNAGPNVIMHRTLAISCSRLIQEDLQLAGIQMTGRFNVWYTVGRFSGRSASKL